VKTVSQSVPITIYRSMRFEIGGEEE
jgi:hypothetical protein